MVVGDVLNPQELEYLEQGFAVVAEGHCTVVGIANTPMPPKERVLTGNTLPWTM